MTIMITEIMSLLHGDEVDDDEYTDHVAAVADVEDDEYGDNVAAVTAAVAGDVGGDDDHGDHVAAVNILILFQLLVTRISKQFSF